MSCKQENMRITGNNHLFKLKQLTSCDFNSVFIKKLHPTTQPPEGKENAMLQLNARITRCYQVDKK